MRKGKNQIDRELREARERRARWEKRQRDGVKPDTNWKAAMKDLPVWERKHPK